MAMCDKPMCDERVPARGGLQYNVRPMRRPKVLLTSPIDRTGRALLEPVADVEQAPATDADTLRRAIADADALIVRAYLPLDLFDHAPRLRAVVRHGAGVDMIPMEAATERGIPVANVPGANATSVAEFVLAQCLLHAHRLARADRLLREAGWNESRALADGVTEVSGKTMGVVGVGAIGSEIARMGHAGFGMRLLGHQRRLDRLPPFVAPAALDTLFAEADFIAIACPLTADTRGLVSERLLARMKPTAFLVNVARGAVLDQAALTRALAERRIGGAALDVFEVQPLERDDPLLALDNVVLTPHLAGISKESMARMSRIAAEETLRILAGERPKSFVNPECWPAALRRRAALGY